MKVNQYTKKTRLDITLTLIVNLCKLNLLWITFTLLGAIIAGIYPATTAALMVSRKWLLTKDYTVSVKEYFSLFKEEFVSANKSGILFTIAGLILFLNYNLLASSTLILPIIVPIAFYILLFSFITTLIWFFPLYVHRENSLLKQVRNAFIIGVLKIPITIIQMLSLFMLLYISLALPTMFLFFTFSIVVVFWMKWGLKGILSTKFKSFENK
ncbi:YesL family protein [Marinilactibacillus sp. GCM10026970]|uniref:YesL family protein n=1 Tax=Marinilactibacillus sp. GCM10026970 TaxID=3252642 RepID=UPI0036181D22